MIDSGLQKLQGQDALLLLLGVRGVNALVPLPPGALTPVLQLLHALQGILVERRDVQLHLPGRVWG